MNKPFFSIITCTFNSAKFLQKNIKSVRNQSCINFEHIFIDGFSSDGTFDILKKYQSEFPDKVKIFQFEAKGISHAMNQGILKADGEYVIHLHSDDNFYDYEVLGNVLKFLEINNWPDWIYGKCNVVEENGDSIGLHPKRKIFQNSSNGYWGKYFLKFYNFIPHQAVFIKKGIFNKFGYFDETISSAMDRDLWLRIKDKTDWRFYNEIISNYCIRKGAESSSLLNRKKNQTNVRLIQKRYLNTWELFLSFIFNLIIEKRNKSLR